SPFADEAQSYPSGRASTATMPADGGEVPNRTAESNAGYPQQAGPQVHGLAPPVAPLFAASVVPGYRGSPEAAMPPGRPPVYSFGGASQGSGGGSDGAPPGGFGGLSGGGGSGGSGLSRPTPFQSILHNRINQREGVLLQKELDAAFPNIKSG